jgi:hypothetical protein
MDWKSQVFSEERRQYCFWMKAQPKGKGKQKGKLLASSEHTQIVGVQ